MREKYSAKRIGRKCKREKRGINWGKINIRPKKWAETVTERREEKQDWGEINIEKIEWDKTVKERREELTGAR